MKTLKDMRDEHGEFVYPEKEELWTTVQRIDSTIQMEVPVTNEHGISGLLTRQARLDIASHALSEADGYKRVVTTYNDLTRAELNYIEAWIATHKIVDALVNRGWSKEKEEPTLGKALEMLKGATSIKPRTANKLLARYS